MPAASYTRAQLREAVWREIQDLTGAAFDTDLVNDLINDAMADWCQQARLRRENASVSIVANQSVYDLSTVSPRVIEILRASCPTSSTADDDRQLELRSVQWMDDPKNNLRNWRSNPAGWPTILIRDIHGPQSLRLYPTPDSSQAATVRSGTIFLSATTGALVDISDMDIDDATALVGGTVDIQFLCGSLLIYYVAGSTDISSHATTVETACEIAPDFQDALLWYCAARCCEMDVPIAQRDKAAGYWAKWEAEVTRARQLDMAGMQSRPGRTNYGSNF